MPSVDLSAFGLHAKTVYRNPAPAELYTHAIRDESSGGAVASSAIADSGALIAYSGAKTGRSPNDKRVVRDNQTEGDIWWGPINVPLSTDSFREILEHARAFLNSQDTVFCTDAFAGWDPAHRLKVRVLSSRPYHALFMHTMLIRPTPAELAEFAAPDFVIYNAGAAAADTGVDGVSSPTNVSLSFEDRAMVIMGTEYAGEMKKGVFTIMNYLMPKHGILSMHCSATASKDAASSSLLFGLSGTGKTTLSADPKRLLVGDDEHCWSDTGIFNIEGGCYAKAINLTAETEPQIYQALRFGAILENVIFDPRTHAVDFSNTDITENTRGAYPIEFIRNAKIPCVAGHPSDVIFLTCDAFGVLPPVSQLTDAQAMYHFISGYTAKVAGTEVGVTEPQATFSPCFGGPFLVWHPSKYAEMLAAKMKQHKVSAWLVNTGWTGGGYGVGSRIKLGYTRAIIDAIHGGALREAPTQTTPTFGLHMITAVPEVPSDILVPRKTWRDDSAFVQAARKLAGLFSENFRQYESGVSESVRSAGPRI